MSMFLGHFKALRSFKSLNANNLIRNNSIRNYVLERKCIKPRWAHAAELRAIIGNDTRAYIVYDEKTNKFSTSNPSLDSLVMSLSDDNNNNNNNDEPLSRDFDGHEGIFFEVGRETNAIFSAFIHKTPRGLGSGGLRYWSYSSVEEYVCDGLRLSKGMGRKNALAGLWWGGGKGIIWREDNHPYFDRNFRDILFKEYGEFITSLKGAYITAEDLGVTVDDMKQVFSTTRHTTCIPQEFGGSGNPSWRTAEGIISAMEGALSYNNDTLENKRISIQGFGNVSTAMIRHLFKYHHIYKIKSIYVTDINPNVFNIADKITNEEFPNINIKLNVDIVPFGDNTALFKDNIDIISPCAIGGILNKDTIPKIKSKYIIGAANNQLLDEINDDILLKKLNKYYIPDFLANRMGIVNCSNEMYGSYDNDNYINDHFDKNNENSIYNLVKKVLNKSNNNNIPTGHAANIMADQLMKEFHPIWGHRAKNIIKSLVDNKWQQQKNTNYVVESPYNQSTLI